MKLARHLFNKIDSDNSGHIGLEEFKCLLNELGLHLTATESTDLFSKYDVDGSGG